MRRGIVQRTKEFREAQSKRMKRWWMERKKRGGAAK